MNKPFDKLAGAGDLRKIVTPPGDTLAKVAADYADMRKSLQPIAEKLAKLEARVEEIGRQPVPPPILRKVIAEPAADPGYDAIAGLLEKAARAGLGREFDDAATQLRRRCDSAPALAAASFNDIQNRGRA